MISLCLRKVEISWNLTANIWKKHDRDFPQIWQKSKTSHDISINKLLAERKFSQLSIIKHKFCSTMLKERLNRLSSLYRKCYYNITFLNRDHNINSQKCTENVLQRYVSGNQIKVMFSISGFCDVCSILHVFNSVIFCNLLYCAK